MTQWERLANDPTARRLAALLRREYGMWIGFVDRTGRSVPVGGAQAPLFRPICARYMANVVDAEIVSCASAMRFWAEAGADGGEAIDDEDKPTRACHAGFWALTAPICVAADYVGSVYASGFVAAERRQVDLAEVLHRGRRAGLWSDASPETGAVPCLDASQRTCVLAILRALATLATEVLTSELLASAGKACSAATIDPSRRYPEMIGDSAPMRRLFDVLDTIATSDSTVLIRGENGSGKELIARAVHRHSRRRDAPFVVQNCAAIPPELIQSELFGHKKGAFSGAHRDRAGLFQAAHTGTFFLDEIGDMDLTMQARLLQALQDGTFLPVGDTVSRKVDVRILCATNRDLEAMAREGSFREDLLYRIDVITVEAPALRHRREDLAALAEYFLQRACRRHGRGAKRLSGEALVRLGDHPWPGNVRELENEIERVVIMSGEREEIEEGDLTLRTRAGSHDAAFGLGDLTRTNLTLPEAVERLERLMILEGLRRTGWNKTQTAREIGVSRRNLIRKVALYDLEED